MKTIAYASRAESDRAAHWEYLAVFSASAAARMDARIEYELQRLANFPMSGRIGRLEGTRELPLARTPLVAVYEIHGGTVLIVRILHGAQDWAARF